MKQQNLLSAQIHISNSNYQRQHHQSHQVKASHSISVDRAYLDPLTAPQPSKASNPFHRSRQDSSARKQPYQSHDRTDQGDYRSRDRQSKPSSHQENSHPNKTYQTEGDHRAKPTRQLEPSLHTRASQATAQVTFLDQQPRQYLTLQPNIAAQPAADKTASSFDNRESNSLKDRTNVSAAETRDKGHKTQGSSSMARHSAPINKTSAWIAYQLEKQGKQDLTVAQQEPVVNAPARTPEAEYFDHHKEVPNKTTMGKSYLEEARQARQRIDLKTITEPTLVSSKEDLHSETDTASSCRYEDRIKPWKQSHNAQRDRHTSLGFAERGESRGQELTEKYMSGLRDYYDSHMNEEQASRFNVNSFEREEDGRVQIQGEMPMQLEQFQMNRNQTNSAQTSQGASQQRHSIAQHFYGKQSAQQPSIGGRSGKNRQPELSKTAVDHSSNVASYLTAQPQQAMAYGRRDNKSNQTTTNQYGSSQKNLSGAPSALQQASNLLRKNSKEASFNQVQISGAGSSIAGSHGSSFEVSISSKQQMIQNLNQRYQTQQQNYSSNTSHAQVRSSANDGGRNARENLDNVASTNISTQESVKQGSHKGHSSTTGATAKTRASSKAHAGAGGPQTAQSKQAKVAQAKTTSQLHPRKSSTGFYSTVLAPSSQPGNGQSSKNANQSTNQVSYALNATHQSHGHQSRPHTSFGAGYAQGTQASVGSAVNRSFAGGATALTSLAAKHDHVTGSHTQDGSSQLQKAAMKAKIGTSGTRSSTSHAIKGRNLNSSHQTSSKVVNKTQTASSLVDTSNHGQILAVNMLPTSQSNNFQTASSSTQHHRSTHNQSATGGHSSVKSTSQTRPSTAMRAKSSVAMKNTSTGNVNSSKLAHSSASVAGTAKSGSRVAQSNTLSNYKASITASAAASKHQNMSHIVGGSADQDDSILDLKQIEDMMRASQASNMFSIAGPDSQLDRVSATPAQNNFKMTNSSVVGLDSDERALGGAGYHSVQQQLSQSISQQMSAGASKKHGGTSSSIHDQSNFLNDISVASPSTALAGPSGHAMSINHNASQSAETVGKAKLRLETVCLLLGEQANMSSVEKEKKHVAIQNVLEELVCNQANKYDSQCLRLLMDYQWQQASNAQTFKLQDELAQVKSRFEQQSALSVQNKDLKEQLAKHKALLQDQDRMIRKLEREMTQLKSKFEIDDRETRIRSTAMQANQVQPQTKEQVQKGPPERAASQQNRRSSILVPPLDLTKVKAYEDHLKDKAAAQKQKEKTQSNYQKQPSAGQLAPKEKNQSSSLEKSAGQVLAKQQMLTIQHQSTKVNNFVGGEVNLANMNNLGANNQQSSKIKEAALLERQYQSLEPASHSLSPTVKGKGRNHAYLNHMRHSQENRPTSSSYYASQKENPGNQSFDQMRKMHNHSAAVEGNRLVVGDQQSTTNQGARERVNQRKHSMPPAQVHIPLLDFSKLHKPQQPTQSRAAAKATQPKQSMSQQSHSKQYQTIEPHSQGGVGPNASSVVKHGSGSHYHHSHQHYGSTHGTQPSHPQAAQTIQYDNHQFQSLQPHEKHAGNNSFQQSQHKRSSYDPARQSRDTSNIGASQSVKVMAPQIHQSDSQQAVYGQSAAGKKYGASSSATAVAANAFKKQHVSSSALQGKPHEVMLKQQNSSTFKSDFSASL